jgi:hypothetical protein
MLRFEYHVVNSIVDSIVDPNGFRVGQVRFLDSGNNHLLHNQIHGVPALVLDCNQNIDFQIDMDVQEEFGTQIKAYFEFVRELQGYKEQHRIMPAGMSRYGQSGLRASWVRESWIPAELAYGKVRVRTSRAMARLGYGQIVVLASRVMAKLAYGQLGVLPIQAMCKLGQGKVGLKQTCSTENFDCAGVV